MEPMYGLVKSEHCHTYTWQCSRCKKQEVIVAREVGDASSPNWLNLKSSLPSSHITKHHILCEDCTKDFLDFSNNIR